MDTVLSLYFCSYFSKANQISVSAVEIFGSGPLVNPSVTVKKRDVMNEAELKKRIEELEAENRALTYTNEELVKAVNSSKARQMLSFLFKKASKK